MATSRTPRVITPDYSLVEGLDDEPSDKKVTETGTRWKRFHPLRAVRRIFRWKIKRDDAEESHGPNKKSHSTSELQNVEIQDKRYNKPTTPYASTISVSHDSIFSPDQNDEMDSGNLHRAFSSSLPLHSSGLKDFSEELFNRVRQRRDSDDEDIGLPHSPCTSPTTADILAQGLKDKSSKSQSTCSAGSLISMGSSENDEEFSGQASSYRVNRALLRHGELDVNTDVTQPVPLSHKAAHHRISVKPKRTHGLPRNRQRQQLAESRIGSLPSTPEVSEELGRPVSPKNNISDETERELVDCRKKSASENVMPLHTPELKEISLIDTREIKIHSQAQEFHSMLTMQNVSTLQSPEEIPFFIDAGNNTSSTEGSNISSVNLSKHLFLESELKNQPVSSSVYSVTPLQHEESVEDELYSNRTQTSEENWRVIPQTDVNIESDTIVGLENDDYSIKSHSLIFKEQQHDTVLHKISLSHLEKNKEETQLLSKQQQYLGMSQVNVNEKMEETLLSSFGYEDKKATKLPSRTKPLISHNREERKNYSLSSQEENKENFDFKYYSTSLLQKDGQHGKSNKVPSHKGKKKDEQICGMKYFDESCPFTLEDVKDENITVGTVEKKDVDLSFPSPPQDENTEKTFYSCDQVPLLEGKDEHLLNYSSSMLEEEAEINNLSDTSQNTCEPNVSHTIQLSTSNERPTEELEDSKHQKYLQKAECLSIATAESRSKSAAAELKLQHAVEEFNKKQGHKNGKMVKEELQMTQLEEVSVKESITSLLAWQNNQGNNPDMKQQSNADLDEKKEKNVASIQEQVQNIAVFDFQKQQQMRHSLKEKKSGENNYLSETYSDYLGIERIEIKNKQLDIANFEPKKDNLKPALSSINSKQKELQSDCIKSEQKTILRGAKKEIQKYSEGECITPPTSCPASPVKISCVTDNLNDKEKVRVHMYTDKENEHKSKNYLYENQVMKVSDSTSFSTDGVQLHHSQCEDKLKRESINLKSFEDVMKQRRSLTDSSLNNELSENYRPSEGVKKLYQRAASEIAPDTEKHISQKRLSVEIIPFNQRCQNLPSSSNVKAEIYLEKSPVESSHPIDCGTSILDLSASDKNISVEDPVSSVHNQFSSVSQETERERNGAVKENTTIFSQKVSNNSLGKETENNSDGVKHNIAKFQKVSIAYDCDKERTVRNEEIHGEERNNEHKEQPVYPVKIRVQRNDLSKENSKKDASKVDEVYRRKSLKEKEIISVSQPLFEVRFQPRGHIDVPKEVVMLDSNVSDEGLSRKQNNDKVLPKDSLKRNNLRQLSEQKLSVESNVSEDPKSSAVKNNDKPELFQVFARRSLKQRGKDKEPSSHFVELSNDHSTVICISESPSSGISEETSENTRVKHVHLPGNKQDGSQNQNIIGSVSMADIQVKHIDKNEKNYKVRADTQKHFSGSLTQNISNNTQFEGKEKSYSWYGIQKPNPFGITADTKKIKEEMKGSKPETKAISFETQTQQLELISSKPVSKFVDRKQTVPRSIGIADCEAKQVEITGNNSVLRGITQRQKFISPTSEKVQLFPVTGEERKELGSGDHLQTYVESHTAGFKAMESSTTCRDDEKVLPSWRQLAQQRREQREQREQVTLGSSIQPLGAENPKMPRNSKVLDMVNNFQKMQT
ncbi:uncharacterized protein LOC143247462 isoform X2 [Tachypleus tridentatus]|uniref:uncharacterized protein LOC143247462 isoform X2 n=1 Tax=Tachypleus tridentatus TaxID=6853 RepID=UPI003FD54641